MDALAAKATRDSILRRWSERAEARSAAGTVRAHAALETVLPPSGLAAGWIRDPATGRGRVELRIAGPEDGKAAERVRRIVADLALDDASVNIRYASRPRIRIRRPRFQSAAVRGMSPFADRLEPLQIGCSVAHEAGSAGSIGAFVRIDRGPVGVLSCCHVLALSGRAEAGDPVSHPGYPDLDREPANRVGALTAKFTPFIRSQANNLDAAIATLAPGRAYAGTVLPDLPQVPQAERGARLTDILAAAELALGDEVAKLGRSTGYRTGRVTATELETQQVQVDTPRGRRTYTFSNVIEISWGAAANHAFSEPGDSGALVFRVRDRRAVGLLFAGGEGYSYAIQLDRIRDKWGLTLL